MIKSLLRDFRASPFKICPEKSENLKAWLDDLGIVLELKFDNDGFNFSLDQDRAVCCSLKTLERVWILCYAYFNIIDLVQDNPRGKEVDVDKVIQHALQWASDTSLYTKHSWVEGIPIPDDLSPDEAENLDVKGANEIFLCVCSFFLLHEIGHAVYGHEGYTSSVTQNHFIENCADQWAAEWIIQGCSESVFLKRSVAIISALLVIVFVDTFRGSISSRQTHPKPTQRLMSILDNVISKTSFPEDKVGTVYQFACDLTYILTREHLQRKGELDKLDTAFWGPEDVIRHCDTLLPA